MQLGMIVLTLLLAIALIVFLVYRGKIDRKDLEEELNNDFDERYEKKDKNRD
jgi:hypothetical protein